MPNIPKHKKRGLHFKLLLWKQCFVPPGHAQASVVHRGDDERVAALLRVPHVRADVYAL